MRTTKLLRLPIDLLLQMSFNDGLDFSVFNNYTTETNFFLSRVGYLTQKTSNSLDNGNGITQLTKMGDNKTQFLFILEKKTRVKDNFFLETKQTIFF